MVRQLRYYRNKFDGLCEICGQTVPAGHGRARLARNPDRWITSHTPQEWKGSPLFGGWAGGCPPSAPEPASTGSDGAASDPARAELARSWLYRHVTGNRAQEPPPLVVPSREADLVKLETTFIRLADQLDHVALPSTQTLAELHAIAKQQGWT